MKHLSSIVLGAALLVMGATACFDDPTEPLRNGPSRIELERSTMFINVGDSMDVKAFVKDDQGNTFAAAPATWESVDAGVAVVSHDETVIPADAFSRAFVRAVAPGKTYVRLTIGGLRDSIAVWGLPTAFNGTITNATANVGDVVTLNATSALTFTTTVGSESEITVDGADVWILSRTASAITFIAPPVDGGTLTVTNVKLLGAVTIGSLDATTSVTANDNTADDDPATPSAMTLYTDFYGSVSSSDADDYVQFTTTTADSVNFEITFLSDDADLDIGLLTGDGSACAPNPGACYATMGTGNNPELANWRLLAATQYQLDVWVYDIGSVDPCLYRIRTTKIQ